MVETVETVDTTSGAVEMVEPVEKVVNGSSTVLSGDYRKIKGHVDTWLLLHKGETFDLNVICQQLEIREREHRNYITIILSKKVQQNLLEKTNRLYRTIDNTIKRIDWVNASDKDILDIKWPYGIEDQSQFGFDGRITVSPGDVIVVAGNSNMGKTSFALNFLWENMDSYPCRLMGNEYVPGKFKRRVSRMSWRSPFKEDHTPKFELIERREGWKDIISPDSINIIDWIQLADNFYQVGAIIDGIQAKLRNGIALVVLQKEEHKTLGLGGQFGEHLASVYFLIDYQRLTVRKVKEWKEWNPNGSMWGFDITDGGAKFHHIRQIQKCPVCFGSGKTKGGQCERCIGTGFCDIEQPQ